MSDSERIRVMLRVRSVRGERLPDEAARAALLKRVTALVEDAKRAAERSKGPHSQQMKIV
jgi:hypothetical protein